MKKITLFACLAAAGLVGFLGAATPDANNNKTDGGGRRGFRRHAIMQKLAAVGVTDAQKEQIRGIMREFRPTVKPIKQQLVLERRALRKAIHTTPVNEAAIRAQSARVAQIQADLAVKRAFIAERVQAVLTPDQVAKLKEMAAKFDSKVDQWMQRADQKSGGT